MSASDHIHPSQHMNHGHIHDSVGHRGVRDMLGKLVDNDVKFLLSTKKKHHELKIIGNGLVNFSKTPSDHRAIKNMQGDIQRSIRRDIDPEWKFPK
jgi:hypothetical protein